MPEGGLPYTPAGMAEAARRRGGGAPAGGGGPNKERAKIDEIFKALQQGGAGSAGAGAGAPVFGRGPQGVRSPGRTPSFGARPSKQRGDAGARPRVTRPQMGGRGGGAAGIRRRGGSKPGASVRGGGAGGPARTAKPKKAPKQVKAGKPMRDTDAAFTPELGKPPQPPQQAGGVQRPPMPGAGPPGTPAGTSGMANAAMGMAGPGGGLRRRTVNPAAMMGARRA